MATCCESKSTFLIFASTLEEGSHPYELRRSTDDSLYNNVRSHPFSSLIPRWMPMVSMLVLWFLVSAYYRRFDVDSTCADGKRGRDWGTDFASAVSMWWLMISVLPKSLSDWLNTSRWSIRILVRARQALSGTESCTPLTSSSTQLGVWTVSVSTFITGVESTSLYSALPITSIRWRSAMVEPDVNFTDSPDTFITLTGRSVHLLTGTKVWDTCKPVPITILFWVR